MLLRESRQVLQVIETCGWEVNNSKLVFLLKKTLKSKIYCAVAGKSCIKERIIEKSKIKRVEIGISNFCRTEQDSQIFHLPTNIKVKQGRRRCTSFTKYQHL
ncbi:hypothetical protein AHMF7605_04595 [Adhaeribacter arboris]|uniref:Uncharacterized protein n=1 Tax=Adhaeribacter arboris TaxID=2072846 RepID=A0A2T2YBF8_9BACT|nr:hypothetical protein AHMF7605_04595 [Adhaeribacter arboris]